MVSLARALKQPLKQAERKLLFVADTSMAAHIA